MISKNSSGRGASVNPHNRFFKQEYTRAHEEGIDLPPDADAGRTSYLEVFPKTVVNKVISPDVGMDFSINPYQGCEHGCVYCYARNSHEYWGYSAGVDFERKIMVKKNAAELLRKKLDSRSWKPVAISLSGNTDCYQPVERKLKITRSLLEVFREYHHPVGIITKNALITRDLDILKDLAAQNLVRVYLSITTLDEELRRKMEPRTATIKQRLKTVEELSAAGIPVGVMMAPIIPGLNSHEILPLVKEVADRGALKVGYTMVRLNGQIADIFEAWIRENYPDRADKVLHQVANAHGGKVRDSRFGTRMKGEGNYASMVKRTMEIARERYLSGRKISDFDTSLFRRPQKGQLDLWT
jgi:DNA repair photolyase